MATVRGTLIGHAGTRYLVRVTEHGGFEYGRVFDIGTGTLFPMTPLVSVYAHAPAWDPIEGWLREDEIEVILDAVARPIVLLEYGSVGWGIPADDVVVQEPEGGPQKIAP